MMQEKINMNKLLKVYGDSSDNWGDLPNFTGDYINYGYWRDIDLSTNKKLSLKDRVDSAAALYREVLKDFDFLEHESVVEIGCGRGSGLIDVLSKLKAKTIFGIDINRTQIERAAKNIHNKIGATNRIILIKASASATTLPNKSVDKICSIEAAQHFSSLYDFAIESKRVLKNNGRLVFATYFPSHRKHLLALKKLLPLIGEELENATPIEDVCECFRKAGFKNVQYRTIGEHTFLGYEKWVTQVEIPQPQFSHNYYKAYLDGFIDYYVITAY
jgi:cyclopropane fatty-acyl-phospholipid synthase-like methyltransferase